MYPIQYLPEASEGLLDVLSAGCRQALGFTVKGERQIAMCDAPVTPRLANSERALASSIKSPTSLANIVSSTVLGKRRSVRFSKRPAWADRSTAPCEAARPPKVRLEPPQRKRPQFRLKALSASQTERITCDIHTTLRGAKSVRLAAHGTEAPK